MLAADEHTLLCTLVREQDDATLAAFDVYSEDANLQEFLDTLSKVVARHQSPSFSAAARSVRHPSSSSSTAPASSSSSDDEDSDSRPLDSAGREVLELVQVLEQDAKLSPREAQALRRLVDADDEMLMAAHDVFQMENDATDLVDTLQRIARRTAAALSEPVMDSSSGDDEGEESSAGTRDVVYALQVLRDLCQQEHLSLAQARVLMHELEGRNEALVSFAARH